MDAKTSLLLLIVFILTFEETACKRQHRKSRKQASYSSRQIIIKCCGKKSCLNFIGKKKNVPKDNSSALGDHPSIVTDPKLTSGTSNPVEVWQSENNDVTDALKNEEPTSTMAKEIKSGPETTPQTSTVASIALSSKSFTQNSMLSTMGTSSAPKMTNSDANLSTRVPLSENTFDNSGISFPSENLTESATTTDGPNLYTTTGATSPSSSNFTLETQNPTTQTNSFENSNISVSNLAIQTRTQSIMVTEAITTDMSLENITDEVIEETPPEIVILKDESYVPLIGEFGPAYQQACVKNESLFGSDGQLIDADNYGSWETTCGNLYLFGSTVLNWDDNFRMCCSLGMLPLMVENAWKRSCLQKFIDGPNWKHSSMYWTTGKRMDKTSFMWYDKRANFSSNMWETGQPNNVNGLENCVMLRIFKFDIDTVKLNDVDCQKLAVFSCVGPTTPAPKCSFPTCPQIKCTKNESAFTNLVENSASYLTEPKKYGLWVEINYRTFMFSFANDLRSYKEALRACCAIDFSLLSLHQGYKFDSIGEAFKNLSIKAGKFWTSGSDAGCSGQFGFCATNRTLNLNETIWMPNQPDNATKNEHCLAVNSNNFMAALSDEPCDKKFRYICEGRASRGTKALELECASAFQLTEAEMALAFLNPNASEKFSCFITCYSENANLYQNGKMNGPKILPLIPVIANGNDSAMKESYDTIGQCSESSKSLSGCSRVSNFVACNLQKSPNQTMKLADAVEVTITEKKSWLPPQSESLCPNHYPNALNEACRDIFYYYMNNQANFAPYRLLCRAVCGKKFMLLTIASAPMLTTLAQAMSECAKFGLRLATIDTKAKLDCMISNSISVDSTYSENSDKFFAIAAIQNKPLLAKNCFSDVPFGLGSWIANNFTVSDGPFIFVNFFSKYAYSGGGGINRLICETI
ncbi:uncharacterized protein LOC132193028 [Neocloeon triangulifer]|uniref:uncharacterized protein LOC132193028 n=1 Tax=Neocloeon triangulifer TaxID=2078957 RepID=UPI00286F58F6|nr:uncharacterized protein LOC132193028 [Neocloeon triangulifer]